MMREDRKSYSELYRTTVGKLFSLKKTINTLPPQQAMGFKELELSRLIG